MTTARRDVQAVYPLSPMQEGMLFHTLESAAPGMYVAQMTFAIDGDLDERLFRAAWDEVTARHDVLRTAVTWTPDGRPLQVVFRRASLRVDAHDWRADAEESRVEALARILDEDRRRGLDLRRAPIGRVTLLHWRDREWRVVWTHHHFLLDGWSNVLLLKEVWVLYEGLARGTPVVLPKPRPYRDYIAWLTARDLGRAEEYWREALAGVSAPTPLPLQTDGAARSGETGSHDVRERWSAAIRGARSWRQIQAGAQRMRVTVSTLVLGAWAVLLGRYSGESDVVFGATIAGRPADLAGVEQMVGLFINTIPVRADARGGACVGEWLRTVQQAHAMGQQYGYVPLVTMHGWTAIPRGQALFESLVVVENHPADAFEAVYGARQANQTLRIRGAGAIEQTDTPLTFTLGIGDDVAELGITADRGRWGVREVEQMLRHAGLLLMELTRDPGRRLDTIALLTEAERQQMLAWMATPGEPLDGIDINTWFDEAVARTPQAPAVTTDTTTMTYAALAARVEQLAAVLRRRGVGHQQGVAIHLERGPDYIAAVLAAWRVGAWYLPLDRDWPDARRRAVLDGSGVNIILTTRALARELPGDRRAVRIDAARRSTASPRTPATRRRPAVHAASGDELAYVIHTSGSTGKPKGVMLPHRGLLNHLRGKIDHLQLAPGDVIAQTAPASFDISIWQMIAGLLVGGTVHVIADDEVQDAARLIDALENRRVTVMETVPSQLAVWLDLAAAAPSSSPSLRALRCVVSNAEALPASLCARWRETYPDIALINTYGATECADDVTHTPPLDRDDPAPYAPFGQPIPGASIRVVDLHGQLAPIGAPGEVVIGGACVGRGYLDQPGLTADRFVPDAYGAAPGARAYRTGDRGRWRADGQIEFLGRFDHQTKWRGHRIETGEIEAVLLSHPAVRQTLVCVRTDEGVDRLAAYLVADGPVDDLRAWLAARLPAWMVPNAIVTLDAMPVTPHGKIDRRVLPPPLAETHQAPPSAREATALEAIVAGMWEAVLGRPRVGLDEDFFELGGHSLLATQVLARVRAVFDVSLPVRVLFDAPTVAGLSEQIARARGRSGAAAAPPLVPVPRDRPLALSFAQQRLWLLDQLEPGSIAYNCPIAIALRGPLSPDAVRAAFAAIVARHEALRTRFLATAEEPVQVIDPPAAVPVPLIALDALPAAHAARLARRLAFDEVGRPFDLARGPLLRVRLIRKAAEDHILLLTLHHIVSDGWSMGVMMSEFAAAYTAAREGRAPDLPPLELQYADYAAWQREWLQGERFDQQLAYWRGRLDGLAPLALPTDRRWPAAPTRRAGRVPLTLSPELSGELRAIGRREGVTLFMTMLAAAWVLLARDTGQDDLAIGAPVANRHRLETESLIGFFVNTLALRIDLSGIETFHDLLQRTRALALEADTHQDLPFERVVQELAPQRDLTRAPLLQVILTLQAAPRWSFALPGLELESLPPDRALAKFDLAMLFADTAGAITGHFEYAAELFDRATIDRMAGRYARLLEALVRDPRASFKDVPLLSDTERAELLRQGRSENAPYHDAAPAACLHELFEENARRRPDAVLLACEDEQISAAALNVRANAIARHLGTLGITPAQSVAFCLPRGIDMVATLLAILKSGGAYIPLTPQLPPSRLAFILENTNTRIVVTTTFLLREIEIGDRRAICLDTIDLRDIDGGEAGPEKTRAARPRVDPEQTAYVMFTSGSTGTPKGAAIPHRAVPGVFRNVHYGPFDETQIYLQQTSILWDVASFELWPTLIDGGRCVLMPSHEPTPEEIAAALSRHGITTAWLTAPLFACLVDTNPESLAGVRFMVTGGDVVSARHVRRLQARYPGMTIVNGYGPSEASILATCYPAPPAAVPVDTKLPGTTPPGTMPAAAEDAAAEQGISRDADSFPIGRPMGDRRVYVLDRRMNLVPVGIAGELFIGGRALAHGYLHRPALTAARFVPDPFSETPGARLYRTGDRAHWHADGQLRFDGRTDQQLKIRGNRVEPGEIETALGRHPAVREAVVVARPDPSAAAQMMLVAYVAVPPPRQVDRHTLRAWLRERLPEYMVPGVIVVLDALPHNAAGKIDRKALPPPDAGDLTTAAEYAEPRTAIEEGIARIWAGLLGRDRLGIHDDFFELGGHSLSATRVMARVREAFRADLPLRVLFEHPTIAGLALEVERWLERHDARAAGRAEPQSAATPPDALEHLTTRRADREADERLLARIDDMSDAEVDALLAKLQPPAAPQPTPR